MKRLLAIAALSALLGVVLAAAGGLVWLNWPASPLEARFDADACHRLALTHPETGAPITGIEDIDALPDGRLILSAYDRLSAERGDGPGPGAGLFLFDPAESLAAEGTAVTPSLIPSPAGAAPHGIDYEDGLLGTVYRRHDARGRARISIGIQVLETGRSQTLDPALFEGSSLCAANDLVLSASGSAVERIGLTLDRQHCDRFALGEMLFPEDRGRILDIVPGRRTRPIKSTSPNGLLRLGDRLVYAETRKDRLRSSLGELFPLPGSPDNLSATEAGAIVAAVHPSLIRLGLYRYGWTDHAPSRIVRIPPNDATPEILFDDPAGTLFSGATVAILDEDRLVAGSVRDSGLLICGGER